MMRRASFLAALTAFATTRSLGYAQERRSLSLGSAPNEDVVAVLWGQKTGAFERAGIDLTVQRANSGAAVAAAVAGHSLDFGKSNIFSLLTARARGLPFVLVSAAAVYDARHPTLSLVVGKDSPIRKAHDLNGKTFGCASLEDLASLGMRNWMDKNGGDSSTVRFLEMPVTAIAAAIRGGRVDMGVMEEPALAQALAGGGVRVLSNPFDAIADRFTWAAFFTTSDFARQNPALIASFRRVVAASADYVNQHHDATVDLEAAFTGIEPSVIASMPRTIVGATITPAMLQPIIDVAVRYEAIPERLEASAFIA